MKVFTSLSLATLVCASLLISGCKPQNNNQPDIPNSETNLDHLIIEEVFYIGTWHERKDNPKRSGRYMYDDTYIKIHNPLDKEMYLDGLALVASTMSSTHTLDLVPDDKALKEKNLATNMIAVFPGSGKEYKIEPHKSVIIASAAVDHRQDTGSEEDDDLMPANLNSFDLTSAPFQWYPKDKLETSFKKINDKVVVLDNITDTNFKINSDGVLALVDLHTDGRAQKVMTSQYDWTIVASAISLGSHSHAQTFECRRIPNEWIIDAISIASTQEAAWAICAPEIDKSHVGVILKNAQKNNPQYLGKSIVRKYNGKSFVDTNDSAKDFGIVDASLKQK